MQSLEPGESWMWCYVDEIYLEAPAPPPQSQGDEPPEGPLNDVTGDSRGIIRSYLVLASLYTLSASLIWGVNTLFLLEAGLDILQVFIANAVFTASMALFEIPTGVLADTRGRRTSFLLSVAVLLVGTLGYVGASAVGGGLLLFSLMSVILGLGYTFYSGATEAWLVDALNASGFSGKLDQVFARSAVVTGIAMLIGTVGGGFLGQLNLAIPFLGRALLLLIVFVIAYFSMHDMGFTPREATFRELPGEMSKIARASVTYGWQNRPVRLLIIASFIQAIFFAWGFYAWQPYFLDLLGLNLTWVAGVIAALISLATIIGNTLVEYFSRFCGRRTTLMLGATGIGTVAAIGVGLAGNFWVAVGLYLVVMAASGVWMPVKQAFMHELIPSEQRATVISFDSLVSSSGSVVGQAGLGYIAQTRSIAAGYVVGGLITGLAIPVVLRLRRLEDPSDVIVGEAGVQGTCAAQGLPDVAAVETTPVSSFES